MAVLAFQQAKGLKQDGSVGPKTRTALGLRSLGIPTPSTSASLSPRLDIALAELGVHENSLPGRHTARIIEYHQTTTLGATDDETPWCSSFVNWVIRQSGGTGTNNAAAKSWLAWGTPVDNPQLGDVVVIKRKTQGVDHVTGSSSGFHVGFYVSSTASQIRILGGNQADQVKYSNFPLSGYEVKGYRR